MMDALDDMGVELDEKRAKTLERYLNLREVPAMFQYFLLKMLGEKNPTEFAAAFYKRFYTFSMFRGKLCYCKQLAIAEEDVALE